jgi:hypothetical protein
LHYHAIGDFSSKYLIFINKFTSVLMLHSAVLADPETFAVLGELGVAFLFRFAGLQAPGGVRVRFRHRAMVPDVLSHVRRIVFLACVGGKHSAGDQHKSSRNDRDNPVSHTHSSLQAIMRAA